MMTWQPGVVEDVPLASRYLFFRPVTDADPRAALRRLASRALGVDLVVGLGAAVVARLGGHLEGLREAPRLTGAGVAVPSTPSGVWCWLRGDDRGELVHRGRALVADLGGAFELERVVDGFRHGSGRDLTGYEDGTENPTGERAHEVAFVRGRGAGLDGSSFVAVQVWRHDLDRFEAMAPEERDRVIGRRRTDNVELADAPPSAHVKRTAQESFSPEAFVVRRSMPWADAAGQGLVFVAFGRSFDAFEALLARMVGAEDDITDALFRFTRPVSGSYFWCPPVRDSALDLSALGL